MIFVLAIDISSGFKGGGGGDLTPLFSGIRLPADPKDPPFVLFWDTHFWQTDLKIFLKKISPPIDKFLVPRLIVEIKCSGKINF